jgi:RNA polymerase sigma factor for flagellar operon FliA
MLTNDDVPNDNSGLSAFKRATANLELTPEQQAIFMDPKNLRMVKQIAYNIFRKIRTANQTVELTDLIQTGQIGLITAIKNYTPARNAHFKTYAARRINGEIMDSLRETDPLSRHFRNFYKKLDEAERLLTSRLGRPPNNKELAEQMGVERKVFEQNVSHVSNLAPFSVEDMPDIENYAIEKTDDPADIYHRKTMHQIAVTALKDFLSSDKGLTPQQKTAVMNYLGQKNFKEIGKEMRLTESRACQLIHDARNTIGKHLKRNKIALEDFSYE